NVEPYELDAIPDNQSLSERLKLLEDLVYSQNKTYWLLEQTKILSNKPFKDLYTKVFELREAKYYGEDASQKLFSTNLIVQYGFYTACRQNIASFPVAIERIKRFIKNCKEDITFPFILDLTNKFAQSELSAEDLEETYKDICSVIPIVHADKFTLIYYTMIIGYFEKTKDYNKNLQFIKKWMLSKYSFILTGFQHKKVIVKAEAAYYPHVADLYTAFADALHDIRLIDNIINYNALEFTFKGLCYYPRNIAHYFQDLITNLTERYFKALKKENNYGMYKGIFVNRHGADARRFSYTVYRRILRKELGHNINSTEYNEPNSKENLESWPAFIYDAILKVLLTMAPAHYKDAVEKISDIAVTKSNLFKCDKNYADFLCETFKAKSCAYDTALFGLSMCFMSNDIPSAILLIKNMQISLENENRIDLFKDFNRVPDLIEGIKNFEFANWENETPILKMLKEHRPELVETMLKRMSMQPSCYFEVPSEDINNYIIRYYNDIHNYKRLGSVAFVCRNIKLLESFRDDLNEILTNWDFALSLQQFYKGVISPEGTKNIFDLPFFKIYYAELIQWLDKNIADDDAALKISRMLMVAKLASRDLNAKKKTIAAPTNMDTSISTPAFELEKDMLLAVGNTTVGFQAFCAFQCYLSSAFKKHLEGEIFSGILAIEGAGSTNLLRAREFRVYYRNLLKLLAGLNIREGMISCSEEEMRKFLELLAALEELEAFNVFDAIKSKNEIKDISTDIGYYTDVISVLPHHACEIVYKKLKSSIQESSIQESSIQESSIQESGISRKRSFAQAV
ncbi:hypothetical protein ENBRE01_2898, partial [Enteropsectra breve]